MRSQILHGNSHHMIHISNFISLGFCVLTLAGLMGCARTTSRVQTTQKAPFCFENQMVLDIGSGSSKVLFATVDTCLQQIKKVHWQDNYPLKVKESLKANQNRISDAISRELIAKIQEWKSRTGNNRVSEYKAVATEAFRQAANGAEFLKDVSMKTRIPIRIIDQKEEAHLGFWSALARSQLNSKQIVVWDIGGGSMQITSLSDNRRMKSSLAPLGAVSFKDAVLKMKKDHQPITSELTQSSPNPLGEHFAHKAVELAKNYADKMISQDMRTEIQRKQVIGIGGVHNHSVLPKVKTEKRQDFFTDKQLAGALEKYQSLNDAEIASAYSETEVTNLALVLGFMSTLHIKQVKVVSVDLTYGLLVFPSQ